MNPNVSRPYTGPLKAAIFDWAGTTLDFGCMAPSVVFVEVFKRHGVPITIEQARGPMGANKRVHIQEIAAMDEVAAKWEAAHGRKPAGEDIDAMYRDFVPLQLDCLADYADLIPGTLETVENFRARGMKIGSTTGYSREMMDIVVPEAQKRGYIVDSCVCANEVPSGRPHPWMCVKSAMEMEVYPFEACVKIGDTLPDIYEGLNAGMWTIGLILCGNEAGLPENELNALNEAERDEIRARGRKRFLDAGAHYVVDSIGDTPPIIDEINARLANGERP